jgi:hypothetical protein
VLRVTLRLIFFFQRFLRKRCLYESGKVGTWSQQAKSYVQLLGFSQWWLRRRRLRHSDRPLANRLFGKTTKGGESMIYRRRAGDKKYTDNHTAQTDRSSKLMIATALSSRFFFRTLAGTITPTSTSIIRRSTVRPSLSLLGGMVRL